MEARRESTGEEGEEGPAPAAYATLRVPLVLPSSLDGDEELLEGSSEDLLLEAAGAGSRVREGEPQRSVIGAACKSLLPLSSLTCFGRSASLFPQQSSEAEGSAPAAPEAAEGAAAALQQPSDNLVDADRHRTASAQQPGGKGAALLSGGSQLRSTATELAAQASAGSQPQLPLLTQDQVPSQAAYTTLQACVPCEVQRVGARASSSSPALACEPGGSRGGGASDSPEPAYESDFDDGEQEPQPGQAASSCADCSRSPSRLGQYLQAASSGQSEACRPSSCPALPRHRPKPSLEDRMAVQMRSHPASWPVAAVYDWLEFIGLGQYRKRFVHHCITGELLLRLSPEQLKVDIGIGPLGHREGLLRAVADLTEHYERPGSGVSSWGRSQDGEDGEGSVAGSSGGSSPARGLPGSRAALDMRVMRAYEQRQRLVKDLQKAEAREAHRRRQTEDAMRTLELAIEEVRKLKAAIAELDKTMGWQAGSGSAAEQLDSLDTTGALPWHPVGQCSRPTTSPGAQPSSPQMSRMSRRIMEGQETSFLERLQADIASRHAKRAAAQRAPPSLAFIAGGVAAEREQEAKDLKYIRDLLVGTNSELYEQLGSGSPADVEQGLEQAAEDLGLDDTQVAAVKRASGVAGKASKLAGYVRATQFMERLQSDLATREARQKELQKQWLLLEGGRNPAQQEVHDAEKARQMFALLGWPEGDLADVKPEDATSPLDDLLGGLLNRVWELRRAAEKKKEPDWSLFRKDGLNEMQEKKITQLQAALEESKRQQQKQAEQQAAARAGRRPNVARAKPAPPELPAAKNYLQETVQLLGRCRHDEIEMLERLSGFKKMVMVYRAVRAMKFVEFTRADLEQRKHKAEALAQQVYPANRRVLPKEQFDKFFERLLDDTNRRLQNKAEIAEKAKQEALAKLTAHAAAPRRHPQSAHV